MGINEHNGIMLFAAESDSQVLSDSRFCQTADSEARSCCTAYFALRDGHSVGTGPQFNSSQIQRCMAVSLRAAHGPGCSTQSQVFEQDCCVASLL